MEPTGKTHMRLNKPNLKRPKIIIIQNVLCIVEITSTTYSSANWSYKVLLHLTVYSHSRFLFSMF